MAKRVKIVKIPKALSGLEIKMQPGLYGTNGNRQFSLSTQVNSQKFAQQPTEVRNTLQPVAREGANLEAERGETAVVNIDGIPAHFKIGGKRHTQGGTPLNLPDNSFIFSDTAKMRIKDPVLLAQFGMVPKKAGYTPAEIAKKYDINKFRQVLADPNTEDIERKTAEMMIANYNMKLAKLALIQESMKGFPQGVPVIAMPYIIENEIDMSMLAPTQAQEEQPDADTGEARYGGNMVAQFDTKRYGGLPQAQKGNKPTAADYQEFGEGLRGGLKKYQNILAAKENPFQAPITYDQFTGKKPVSKRPTQWPVETDIKKGFSGNHEEERKFAMDPDTRDQYALYKMGMQGDTADIKNAMAALEEQDVDNSLGLVPTFEDQDIPASLGITPAFFGLTSKTKERRVRGLENILKEELEKAREKKTTKKYTAYREQKENSKLSAAQASDLYRQYKHLYDIERDIEKKAKLGDKLEELYKLNPLYKKGETFPTPEESMLDLLINPLYKFPTLEESIIYYSPDEQRAISRLAAAYPKYPMADTAINMTDIPNMSDTLINRVLGQKAAGRNIRYVKAPPEQKAYGGSLDKYQGVDKGNQVPQAPIDPMQAEANKRKADTEAAAATQTAPATTTVQQTTPGTGTKKVTVVKVPGNNLSLTPEELEKRKQTALTAPETYVTQEDYDELERLYKKAEAADRKNPGKKNKETEDFQIAYHNLLPAEAKRVIASETDLTAKGKERLREAIRTGKARDPYNLGDNVDGYFGKRTKQYWQKVKKATATPETTPDVNIKTTPAEPNKKRDPFKTNSPRIRTDVPAPFDIRDIASMARAFYKKGDVQTMYPFQAIPQTFIPQWVPASPERELAYNTEQANLANQYAAAFSGFQPGAASLVQGKALANAANVMDRYNQRNIDGYNQYQAGLSNILNTAAQNKAKLATDLYDKYQIANQQTINTKDKRGADMFNTGMNALGNRASWHAINTLNPNFYANPLQAGMINFTGDPNQIYASKKSADELDNLYEKAKKYSPGDPASMMRALLNSKKQATSVNEDDNEYANEIARLRASGLLG
jgi:hypothetical protein